MLLLLSIPASVRDIPHMRRHFPSHAIATGWREPRAHFRLTILHDLPGTMGYLDLRSLCVPGDPAQGVRIYRESDWKAIPIHQFDDFHIQLPPSASSEKYEVYFDFPYRMPKQRWKKKKRKIPVDFRLKQHSVRITIPESPLKMAEYESRKPFISYSRTRRELWNAVGCLMTAQSRLLADLRAPPYRQNSFRISLDEYRAAGTILSGRIAAFRTASRIYLSELYYSPFKKKSAGKDVPRIFFTSRPFDTDRTFLSCFKGNLVVPETGTYEFRLNSNSTRILRIDGKEVHRKTGIFRSSDPASIGSTDHLSLELKKGIVFLEYIYYKEQSATWASLSWKKKGGSEFRLLSSDDFAPAFPVIPLKLEDFEKNRYPLIRRDDSLALFTGKDDPYSMDRFTVLSPDVLSWRWELDGNEISRHFKYILLKPKTNILRFRPDIRSGYPAFDVPLRNRAGEKIAVKPNLSLKLWAPRFLYDDESCSLTLEIDSALPAPVTVDFSGKVSEDEPSLKSFSEILEIPSMPMEGENRYAQSRILKRFFRLEGADLFGKKLSADYSISLPPLVFDRKGILFSPVSALPELSTNEDGLCDGEGRKVIPILHRMSLHEVRSWELLRRIETELHRMKRVLVIAENFGDFGKELESLLERRGAELEFIPLNEGASPSGSVLTETIPSVMRHLKNSSADTAILIPPGTNRHGTAGQDTELYAAALISELLLNCDPIRSVFLATPLPLSPDDAASQGADEETFCENLRKLRREKGFRILELNSLLKKDPRWTAGSYRSGGIGSPFPLGLARRSAELIVSEIAGK